MPWASRWSLDIPSLSLPDFLFTSPAAPLDNGKPLIIDAERPRQYLTHHTYRLWSQRLAAGLTKAGFKRGDRLLLYSGNTIFFPVVLMGTIMAQGVFSGANPTYVARELAYQLQDSGAKILITSEASLPTALEAARIVGFSREQIFVFDDGSDTFNNCGRSVDGIRHWSSLLASPEKGSLYAWPTLSTPKQMAETTAVLNYSSGTTGVPKGVEITHLNYIANCMQTEYMAALAPDYGEKVKRAKVLSFLPMYHAYGQTYHCVTCPGRGVPVYVMRKYDFVEMLRCIEKFQITGLNLVPPIAVALTKRPEVKDFDLSSVESAGCGAAPLGRESAVEFDRVVAQGRFQLRQGWGMTEITCSAIGWDPRHDLDSPAVGELNPNIEGMIVDDAGHEVGVGQRGEFWVRGPNVMKGYWRKAEATKETKTDDGWLKTGDIAFRDKDGLIYMVDRKKELIKVKGNQVAPAELEALLLDHPAVQDAAVVGVTIRGEELPRAYIVPQAEQNATPENIGQWLAKQVAPHKRLAGGVKFTDVIPKNPSGKILRKALREKAAEEVGDGNPRGSKL
ncbi:hypothetical protein D0862_06970 [Hortaea werneckii]|uniref:AMP-dependent synthetase/ligase domain-containing protein n=1 Tax=Hortaea werneckii TaxID=91943 RepID=A0A3M7GFD9_HORWE|nr:hypothetical protein D0862_06970 [Hortaea werneckii]